MDFAEAVRDMGWQERADRDGKGSMATREEFLEHLWREVINALSREQGLENIIENGMRFPAAPFADAAAAIQRMLAAGVSRPDLCLVARQTAYDAVFGTLYALSEPGLDATEDPSTLYEELWGAKPSGTEGRSGSTDAAC
jgi:hypothetical protein